MTDFITFDGIDREVDFDLAIRVVDTSTGQITEKESNLTYSGESGGLNEIDAGAGDYYTQIVWDGMNAAAPEASGPMRESMETMKKAWKDASSTYEGALEVDHAVMMLSFQYDLG